MNSSKLNAEDTEPIVDIKLWTEGDYEYKIKKTAKLQYIYCAWVVHKVCEWN